MELFLLLQGAVFSVGREEVCLVIVIIMLSFLNFILFLAVNASFLSSSIIRKEGEV